MKKLLALIACLLPMLALGQRVDTMLNYVSDLSSNLTSQIVPPGIRSGDMSGTTNIQHFMVVKVSGNYTISTAETVAMLTTNLAYVVDTMASNIVFTFPPSFPNEFKIYNVGTNSVVCTAASGRSFPTYSMSNTVSFPATLNNNYIGKVQQFFMENATNYTVCGGFRPLKNIVDNVANNLALVLKPDLIVSNYLSEAKATGGAFAFNLQSATGITSNGIAGKVNYGQLDGVPVIFGTNGFITLLDLVVVDFNNTNKLASTNWTGANFVLQSAVQNTNGLAGTNWVGANFYLQSNPSGYIATIPADATNGFLAKTNGTASNLTNLTVNAINTVTNYAITDGTNYWSVIGSTNGLFTNFTFNVKTEKWSLFGDGNGLTNYNYNRLINLPIIPATNGFITLADLVTPDFNNTNKLASTNWVGANFLLSTLLQTTNGFITLADLVTPDFNNTNKLASTNWVGANFLLSSLLQQTNGFITQPDAIAAVNTNTIFRSGGTNSLVFQNGYATNVTFVQTNFYVFGNTSTNGMFLSTTGAVMSLVQGGVTNTFIIHTNGNLYVNGYLLMTNGIALNGASLTAGSVADGSLASTFLKTIAVTTTNWAVMTNDSRPVNLVSVGNQFSGNIAGNGASLTNIPYSALPWTPPTNSVVDDYTNGGSFTWTKRTGAVSVQVFLVGGGGGGGSGARQASATARGGGGGGGGGGVSQMTFGANYISNTVTGNVGTNGGGGAADTVDTTSGTIGKVGGSSWFGDYLKANGGGAGAAGTTSGGAAGAAGTGFTSNGGIGGAGAITTGSVGAVAAYGSGGGGGGAGAGAASVTAAAGGAGSGSPTWYNGALLTGGVGGTAAGAAPTQGTNDYAAMLCSGSGGSGYKTVTAEPAGANGAGFGAGGGGGGASDNTFNSGAGGNGYQGWVRIITKF